MITAHSGSDGYQDNSREFITAMLDAKVVAFEIDCQISEAGDLYLSHDELELTDGVLTLTEVYEMMVAHGNETTLINVDCKNEQCGPKALDIAKSMGIKDRVVLSGGLPLELYSKEERQQLFYNLENSLEKDLENFTQEQLLDLFKELKAEGVEIIQLYYGLVNEELMDLVHQAGLRMSVWTVNEIELINHYLALGCYNITTRIALEYLKI